MIIAIFEITIVLVTVCISKNTFTMIIAIF
jgi:hypothetical protein